MEFRNTKLSFAIISCCLFISVLAAPVFAKLSGAIYTSLADGGSVNANIYEAKEDVFLNGGPRSENKRYMALPEGWYYFQVTDPAGKKLLSEDPVICRKFYVNELGAIRDVDTGEDCFHLLVDDIYRQQLDAHTVQLIPYSDTPNRGGVYKLWITPVESFVGDVYIKPARNRDFVFGFIPSQCKTDNFKVKGKCDPSALEVLKFNDINSNGQWDEGEQQIVWDVTVVDPFGASNVYETPVNLYVTKGIWEVEESSDPNWMQTALFIDGAAKEPIDVLSSIFVNNDCSESHQVIYGNTEIFDITVIKFHDKNMNGIKEEGEGWSGDLPQITVRLSGETLGGVAVEKVAVVDADGEVVFEDIVAGNYKVCEAGAPADWIAVTPECVDLNLPDDADSNNKVLIKFANVQKCRISVCKFYDLNRDGVFQEGENWTDEKPEIKFCLTGQTVAGSEVAEICMPTGDDGCVVFDDLLPGDYTICEREIPLNWQPTTDVCVSAVVSSGDKLDLGHVIGNVDFCDITVCKFYDANENGINDEEPLLSGFNFVLLDETGQVIADKCTGDNGCLRFERIYAGNYRLFEVLPVNENLVGVHWKQTTTPAIIPIHLLDDCEKVFEFGNVCSETSSHGFGTKGYWHNKNGLAELNSDQELFEKVLNYVNSLDPYNNPSDYFVDGDEPFDGKFSDHSSVSANNIEGAIAGSVEAEISHFLKESVGDGGIREQLAQQLLAFIFNVHYRIGDLSAKISLPGKPEVKASDLISEAVAAWGSASNEDLSAISGKLDVFNNCDGVLKTIVSDVPCEVESVCE